MHHIDPLLATNVTITFPNWLFSCHILAGMLIALAVGFLLA